MMAYDQWLGFIQYIFDVCTIIEFMVDFYAEVTSPTGRLSHSPSRSTELQEIFYADPKRP